MSAALEVVSPGLCTTVQDLGRPGFQKYGVPISGPMDEGGLRAAPRGARAWAATPGT